MSFHQLDLMVACFFFEGNIDGLGGFFLEGLGLDRFRKSVANPSGSFICSSLQKNDFDFVTVEWLEKRMKHEHHHYQLREIFHDD